ncbi:xylosyltransferase I, putative [Acanthamoeba castellanii str. Neff]|uniref:protein xylosyltransferase n=1 Tax=Acanthamoeba castellanii (strain ATCC 30010 / Neff) TaxID=1257118 RepID=L8H650_ACACF|nr:xylosyltransferase I, putative [Acanthamoeba castellanii str. Neff]ELR20600.1 xylosyltransferase I, putative [Acanthamoeba castellanii str. Neff]
MLMPPLSRRLLPLIFLTITLRLAYLILVHSHDSVLAAQRLLPAIYHPDFYYVIVNELDGLQELLAFGPWDYAINLSGDSYPLVSQARLVERLAYWRGANFVVDGGERPERANEVPAFKAERLAVVKSWPTGVTQPDQFGSQWFVLTREFVEYALTSAFARNVLVAMAADKAQIPDESYFQVVLMNSPFNITVSQRKPGARPLPCFFGPKDFEALVESDCVFTRKMHPEVSGDLYAMLDQHISTQ